MCGVSCAQSTHFDFSSRSYLIENENEVQVEFGYSLTGYKESDFSVRPIVENGSVEIYNEAKDTWVSSFGLFSSFPSLKKNMMVRLKGFEVEKSVLYFQIYNLKTGESYFTPKKSIWSRKVYEKYVEKVNENLENVLGAKDEAPEVLESSQSAVVSEKKPPNFENLFKFVDSIPKRYFFFFGIAVFVWSVIFGYKFLKIGKTNGYG